MFDYQDRFHLTREQSLFLANKILISAGAGILTITDQCMEQSNTLLIHYYTTGETEQLKQFMYYNTILGIQL